jgi:futalosine hydrolase
MTRLLVVTAVGAERDAILAGLGTHGSDPTSGELQVDGAHVLAAGVGVAAAAARTARRLTERACAGDPPYDGVVSAGIGGVYAGRGELGDIVVGRRTIAADLGAESPDGYLTLSDLGFGAESMDSDPRLFGHVGAVLPAGIHGSVLCVHTATGTSARAVELIERHPDAVAEAMEGWGVATAAADHGVPFVEIRAVSNLVGPRDRSAWRIDLAMGALTHIGEALATLVE